MALSVGLPQLLSLGLLFLLSHPTGVACVGRFPLPDLGSLGKLDPLNEFEDVETYLDHGWLENDSPGPHPSPAQPGSYSIRSDDSPSLRNDGAGTSASGQPQSTYLSHNQDRRPDGPHYGQQPLTYSPLAASSDLLQPVPYSLCSDAGSSSFEPIGHADGGNRYATVSFSGDVQDVGTHPSHQVGSSAQQPNQQPGRSSPYGVSTSDLSAEAPRTDAVHRKTAVQSDEINPDKFSDYYKASEGTTAIESASRPEQAIPPAPYVRTRRPKKETIPELSIPYRDFSLPEVPLAYDFYSNAKRVDLPRSELSKHSYRPSSYAHGACFLNRASEPTGWVAFADMKANPEAERAMVLSKVRYELQRWSQTRPEHADFEARFRPAEQDGRSDDDRQRMMTETLRLLKISKGSNRGPFTFFVVNGVWIYFRKFQSEFYTSLHEYHVAGWRPNREKITQRPGHWGALEAYDIGILESDAEEWSWSGVDFRLKNETSRKEGSKRKSSKATDA